MCIHCVTRAKWYEIIKNQVEIISIIKKNNAKYSYIINELTMVIDQLRNVKLNPNQDQQQIKETNERIKNIENILNDTMLSFNVKHSSITDWLINVLRQIMAFFGGIIKTIFKKESPSASNPNNSASTGTKRQNNVNYESGIIVMGDTLAKLKNAPHDMTGIITIFLILFVSALTALPLYYRQELLVIVYQKGFCDTYIHLGVILVLFALAGIWSLTFMYIKSRIKIHEQDTTFLRRFLHDD